MNRFFTIAAVFFALCAVFFVWLFFETARFIVAMVLSHLIEFVVAAWLCVLAYLWWKARKH